MNNLLEIPTGAKTNMKSSGLSNVKEKLNGVGWFIPPYVSVGFLETLASRITLSQDSFTQADLEESLSVVYDAQRLASMTLYRYRVVPVIELFAETISESVGAHFLGLNHVAVGGLIPVVEGAGRRLARDRGIKSGSRVKIKDVFKALASYAKEDVIKRRIGAVDEIVNMLDSFLCFIQGYFYSDSQAYPLVDGTNRHGIAHGAYTDSEYGKQINFYKTIAAVDFLTFISSLNTKRMSGFVPNRTPESSRLAAHYFLLGSRSNSFCSR